GVVWIARLRERDPCRAQLIGEFLRIGSRPEQRACAFHIVEYKWNFERMRRLEDTVADRRLPSELIHIDRSCVLRGFALGKGNGTTEHECTRQYLGHQIVGEYWGWVMSWDSSKVSDFSMAVAFDLMASC